MGVPVWVVPGDPSDEMSQAGNGLLEQGLARALVRVEYFLSTLRPGLKQVRAKEEQLALDPSLRWDDKKESRKEKETTRAVLTDAQQAMLALFRENHGRMTVDELAEKCEASLSALQQELLMLELLGVVQKQGTEFVVT
jgi:predicted Rossmann fold nucleotide-binding protein DprA/Smf involved in DNA uptake